MDATETDFPYEQSRDQVGGQVDSLAGGIMDLLENAEPDHSGEAEAKPEEKAEEPPKEEPEEAESEETEKYTIKWQGQEREVTQDELISLAQQGYDYTQKTQALSQERDQLAPLQGLATLLKSDPVKAAQIAAILQGQAPQQPAKTFDDPIEQLKWETKQEALAAFRAEMQQNVVPLQRQQVLNEVRMRVQADPDYQAVHAQIIEMVKSQPPTIQRNMYNQLDQDPQAYIEAFQHFKTKLTVPTIPPKAATRETKAPILAAGGVAPPEAIMSKEKTQKLSKQKANALRSGDPIAIGDWLLDSGAIDHIL